MRHDRIARIARTVALALGTAGLASAATPPAPAPAPAPASAAAPVRAPAASIVPAPAGSTAALVQRFVDAAWNAGDYSVIPQLFADDYVVTSLNALAPPLGRQTHAQLVEHVREFRTAFPDLTMTVEDVLVAGDRAYVRTRLRGTHRGALFGVPPSGRPVDFVLAAVYRSRDGRLVGHDVLVDTFGLMQQIGALPPPGPPGAMPGGPPGTPPPGQLGTMPAPGTTPATAAAAPRLRTLEPGMRWTYRVVGSVQPAGAPAALPLGGTITITIETLEFRGRPTPALKFAPQLQPLGPPPGAPPGAPPAGGAPPPGAAPSGPPPGPSIFGAGAPAVAIFWFRQDPATGDVHFVGDNHGPPGPDGQPGARAARGDGGLFIPGAWRDGTTYSKRLEWEGGGWTHNWLAVLGVDTIETGLGPRLAWRSPNRSSGAEGIEIDGTDWWAPELGQPVQFDANSRLPDGTLIRIRAVLESTNVRA